MDAIQPFRQEAFTVMDAVVKVHGESHLLYTPVHGLAPYLRCRYSKSQSVMMYKKKRPLSPFRKLSFLLGLDFQSFGFGFSLPLCLSSFTISTDLGESRQICFGFVSLSLDM